MKYIVILFLLLSVNSTATPDKLWILTLDKSDRAINGCMPLSSDGWTALAIAMKCQKSILPSIKLCSQGRILQYFKSKKSCKLIYANAVKTKGKYSLKSDPWENLK